MKVTKLIPTPVQPPAVFVIEDITGNEVQFLCFLLSWGLDHADKNGDTFKFGIELTRRLREARG